MDDDLLSAISATKEKKPANPARRVVAGVTVAAGGPSTSPTVSPPEGENRLSSVDTNAAVDGSRRGSTLDSDDSDEEKPAVNESAESPVVPAPVARLLGDPTDIPLPRYIKKKQLGRGSYGCAWLCEIASGPEKGKYVVAKSMSLPDMSTRERIYAMNELQCMKAVDHPNVIRFIESSKEDDTLIIVMEFADAGDISRHIKARATSKELFRETEVMFIFMQVSLAVVHIHGKHMLHRDIKSANMLISTNGLVKLADFGFSRQYEETVSRAVAKTLCGTPYYLSPELWKNKRYSNKADIWSLGVLMYEFLTLQRPFVAPSLQGLMELIVSGKYAPIPAHYSDDIRFLLSRLLDVNPASRPSAIQIFEFPYVARELRTLITLVNGNEDIDAATKTAWIQGAQAVLAATEEKRSKFVATAPAADGGNPDKERSNHLVHYEGQVNKLSGTKTWSERWLKLSDGNLALTDMALKAKEDALVKEGKKLAPGEGPSTRVLPVDELASVCTISEESAKRKHVFAIHTKSAKCTWLHAPSEGEREMWVVKIQEAMCVL